MDHLTAYCAKVRRLHAQDIPGNVGPEVLAPNDAASGALNGWAPLSWYAPPFVGVSRGPRAQQRRGHSNGLREAGLGATLGGKVLSEIHDPIV